MHISAYYVRQSLLLRQLHKHFKTALPMPKNAEYFMQIGE
jgi:hypothetical protein